MKNSLRKNPMMILFVLGLSSTPAFGQQGAATFKHFESHSSGKWEQTIQAIRGGTPGSMTILRDEEHVAEYEQVCLIGRRSRDLPHENLEPLQGTLHRRPAAAHHGSHAHRADGLQGQCAQLPEMKNQASDGARSCMAEDMPATARASCVAAMQRLTGNLQ